MICEVSMNDIGCAGDDQIRTVCYACGGPACKACSEVVVFHRKRMRRCNDCLEDDRKDEE